MDDDNASAGALTATRRDWLVGSGLGLLVVSQPAIAAAASPPDVRAPVGYNRFAPVFRRVDMQK